MTGTTLNHVEATRPFTTDDGARAVAVYTTLKYNLYWELGWHPAFGHTVLVEETGRRTLIQHVGPRRLLRKEVWRPVLFDTRVQQLQAFVGAAQRVLAGVGATITPHSEAAD